MKAFSYLLMSLLFLASCREQPETSYTAIRSLKGLETQGFAPDRLTRIDQMMEEAIAAGEIPGGVALIARNGNIVYHKAFGQSNTAEGTAFQKNDIFRIASQTKAITSTAVMMLWEEGHFQLDEPISKYIPEFENTGVLASFVESDSSFTTTPLTTPITIRHLLTHTSGIGYGMIDSDPRIRKAFAKAGIVDAFTAEAITLKENVPKIAQMPLHHQPGEAWTYSEGLDVLGRFVEIVSGMPFDQFLKSRIFDPLGMVDTAFYLSEEKANRLVSVQHKEDGQWRLFETDVYDTNYPIRGAKRFFSGGAGLSSTARDYYVFLQMMLNKGTYNEVRLLSRTTVETMMVNQIGDLWKGGPTDFNLAFSVVNDKGIAKGGLGGPGTFEWGGYFNTQYFADPGEQLIGILMKQTQGDSGDQTGWKFKQMVFASIAD
ncbi:MAG: serine hydrolase domain-containing protein [Robiginitalea sp.]|uniref:serine hydrolase domain-containing protein n=1 Tax=Robiginitalea sp. TaxID=1902411 RepID=UPI003C753677